VSRVRAKIGKHNHRRESDCKIRATCQRFKLNQILNQLAASLPETRWLILLDKNGVVKASFPDFISETDRIAAMSAAALSLGGRVTKDPKGGELQYTLFGGTMILV
jgi:predicted regulator of Ras-like GTPase activity (Roadblock/LC7/MglB family)